MAGKNDIFSLREIMLSAAKGMARSKNLDFETVYHSSSGKMEDAKGYEGYWVDDKFYEFKVTRRRDPIDDKLTPFDGVKDGVKTHLLWQYLLFVHSAYPILKLKSTTNRVFVRHCGYDYEVTFIAKNLTKRLK